MCWVSSSGGGDVTIASSLDSGCGLSQECAQDGCNDTCVKLEASKPTLSGNMVLYEHDCDKD